MARANARKVLLCLGLILVAILINAQASQAGIIGPTNPGCGPGGFTCPINVTNHGGAVLSGAVDIFGIFYGDFTSANSGSPITAQQVVHNWISAMNGTTYMNIDSTYGATTNLTYAGEYDEGAYLGTNISNAQILTIVQDAETGGHVATETNAIYFVFTAPGIDPTQGADCGWHDHSGATIYSWVGPSIPCDFLGGNTSGNLVGNEFTETGSHELFEATTDPQLNAYYYKNTAGEVGDVCVNSNSAITLNDGKKYDLQSIWVRDSASFPANGGACAQGYQSTTAPEPASAALLLAGCAVLLGFRLYPRRA
jgi:hypothetical protein